MNCSTSLTIKIIRLIGLIGLIGPISVLAADFSSTNFTVKDAVIEEGGGYGTSSSFQLWGSVPYIQPSAATSTNFGNNSGFFPGYIPITMPVLSGSVVTEIGTVSLSWSASNISNAVYEVGYSLNSPGPYTYLAGQSSLSKTVTGLQPSPYYFVVRLKDGLGEVKGTSNQINLTPNAAGAVAIPAPSPSPSPSSSPASSTPPERALEVVVETLKDIARTLIPDFLLPSEPEPVIVQNNLERFVPRRAPPAFSGRWGLIPSNPLREIIFRPLPDTIQRLAGSFPKLADLFASVGISRFQDLQKLRHVNLKIPGLSDVLGLPVISFKGGRVTAPLNLKGIADLPSSLKQQLPNNIVFARAAGGTIDLDPTLMFSAAGEAREQIRTVAGNVLTLSIKPEGRPVSIKGYLLFRSRLRTMEKPASLMGLLSPIGVAYAAEEEKPQEETVLALQEFEFVDEDGDGIYTASIPAPAIAGNYEIATVIEFTEAFETKVLRLVTVVDPEGYVYELQDGKELRIPGAIVSLEWLNPFTKAYELWPARNFAQENPQVTNQTGEYAFLVPEGLYRLNVNAPGYTVYDGKPFEVKEGSPVHANIEMRSRWWFLQWVDWKTILIVCIGCLLLYNFYRDKMREKRKAQAANL